MRFIIITAACLALLTASGEAQQYGLTFNFAPNPGASLQLNGAADSMSFNNGTNGWQCQVVGEVGGSSAMGLNASVNSTNPGGSFSYGPIFTSGSNAFQVQYATVLAPLGDFVMSDGSGSTDLTGTINWIDVATYGNGIDFLYGFIDINFSNLEYSGSNPDLQYLVALSQRLTRGSVDLSLQFLTTETLTELSTGAGPSLITSYSGSISFIPEPSTLALSGLGGLVLVRLRRR